MLTNIPQFIDKEDKIAGPLTAKQLGWMFAAGAVLFVLWSFLDKIAFFTSAFFVILIFGGLAFWKPQGQPLIYFLFSGVSYLFRPKFYIWKRLPDMPKITTKPAIKKTSIQPIKEKRIITQKKISDIAKLLDNQR